MIGLKNNSGRLTALAVLFVAVGAITVWRVVPVLQSLQLAPAASPTPPAGNLPSGGAPPVNQTDMPLELPPGFSISIFAENLPGARVMRFDQFGNLWVSRTGDGAVALLEIDRDSGAVRNQGDAFTGLKKPHGLAFDPDRPTLLYIAEEHRVTRRAVYSEDLGELVLNVPSGGGHFTRTIGFGPDQRLYISVGSSCNVCVETDNRRAAVLRYVQGRERDLEQYEIFARGLRNAVFFVWDRAGRMWATEMGRDLLGDDLPPDEINIVEQGKEYGWPYFYGTDVRDRSVDPTLEFEENPNRLGSVIDIPAHSAPLGLAFVPPDAGWPQDYENDLLVAYHGSWNRSQPTGYTVVRHTFDAAGRYEGVRDFITGWAPEGSAGEHAPGEALGRPVDIEFRGEAMYLSDDKAGVIYRILPPRVEERR